MPNDHINTSTRMPDRNPKKKDNTRLIYSICGIACVAFIITIIVVIVISVSNPPINEETTFVSNDEQTTIVFASGRGQSNNSLIDTHFVYTYDADGNVTGLKTYFKYPNEEIAKASLEAMKDQPEFKGAIINGQYIVVAAEESQFKGLTVSDVKQQAESIRKYQESQKPQDEQTTDSDTTENIDESNDEHQE